MSDVEKLIGITTKLNERLVETACHMAMAQKFGNKADAARYREECHMMLDMFLNDTMRELNR